MSSTSARRARSIALTAENAWTLFMAAGVAFCVAYFLLPSVDHQDIAYQLPSMAGALAVVAGVAMHRPADWRPWGLLAAGLACTSAGDWTWVVLEANGMEPFPSVADAFYLAGVGLQVGAVLWLVRGRVPGGDRVGMLDALIVAVGVGLVSWIFLMAPIVADTEGSAAEIGVALAYPVLDIVMLGVIVRLFVSGGRKMPSLQLLAAAMVALLVADFGYAFLALNDAYATGQLIEAGWLLAGILWGAAALHPSMRSVADPVPASEVRFSALRLAMLAAASLLAPAVLIAQWASGNPIDVPVIAGVSIALFLLVIARLGSVVTELRATLHQRRLLETELERRALHDPLTGLANRTLFHERLGHALARRDERVAVLFLDIDDFKTVNDSYGHHAGDRVLVSVADALRRVVRPSDTVARLGGDEFAILLEDGPDMYAAGRVADRLLEALRTPIAIPGLDHVPAAASIGIALGVSGSATADDLMREADVAMYVSKGRGKGGFTVFDASVHADVVRGIEVRADLDRAIRERQFELHYQPILELSTGEVVGVEALVRWRHPDRGVLPPAEFIPLAESTGAIVPLGEWILEEACRQAVAWRTSYAAAARWIIGVNASSVQLRTRGFVEFVGTTLTATGLPSDRLALEVAESARLDAPEAMEAIHALGEIGVLLAVDDFGTGYSSLSALARRSFQLVKIDRALVESVATDPRGTSLVNGVVDLAARLGVAVVAEGIEDSEQLAALRSMGCTLGQGFYFARPMPPAELEALIRADTAAAGTRALNARPAES